MDKLRKRKKNEYERNVNLLMVDKKLMRYPRNRQIIFYNFIY